MNDKLKKIAREEWDEMFPPNTRWENLIEIIGLSIGVLLGFISTMFALCCSTLLCFPLVWLPFAYAYFHSYETLAYAILILTLSLIGYAGHMTLGSFDDLRRDAAAIRRYLAISRV